MVSQQNGGVYRLLQFLVILSSVQAFRQVEVSWLEDRDPEIGTAFLVALFECKWKYMARTESHLFFFSHLLQAGNLLDSKHLLCQITVSTLL